MSLLETIQWQDGNFNTTRQGQNDRHYDSLVFASECTWMEIFVLWFIHQWSLFIGVLRKIKFYCLDKYLKQWWFSLLSHVCVNECRWVKLSCLKYHREWSKYVSDPWIKLKERGPWLCIWHKEGQSLGRTKHIFRIYETILKIIIICIETRWDSLSIISNSKTISTA